MPTLNTQVGIIGAGPAGLTLAHWLKTHGIDAIVIEKRSREYVEGRVRAGLLEQNTVDILDELGMVARLKREGQQHHGVYLSFDRERVRIPFSELTGGRNITIYGQKEVVKDLTDAWLADGRQLFFDGEATSINKIDTTTPEIRFLYEGEEYLLKCDFVAACDGFHGIGRKAMPKKSFHKFEKVYPFSWLGILANVAPSSDELIYAYHQNGFALHSLRSHSVSRLYLQVNNDDQIDQWPDDRIWEELSIRLGTDNWELRSGPVTEKGITAMRSYMIDNLQFGRLFLAGDAGHIVPPTGGKGLNLAVADVKHLVDGFIDYYKQNTTETLSNYSTIALKRIWRAQEFSNFMTTLFHKQDKHGSFGYKLQKARFDYLKYSKAFVTTIAENYVGLPFQVLQ